jgi:pimeloyl-ACP methyl ester carboxylesterase
VSRMTRDGIGIEYEVLGARDDPLLVLIRGLGSQMIAWDDRFCGALVARRFRVVRFDNRDIGLSSRITDAPAPDIKAVLRGDLSSVAYTLDDMAADVCALIEHVGSESAHLVGVSMGGMIAQLVAINHPTRVRSLCSIMSTTGARGVGRATAEGQRVLLRPRPRSVDEAIASGVDTGLAVGSPAYPPDTDELAAVAASSYERAPDTRGIGRQMVAVLAARDRTAELRRLDVPTLVIHGDADPLVAVDGGIATAEAVPGQRLLIIPGMGHDLPAAVWPLMIDAIVENAMRAPS